MIKIVSGGAFRISIYSHDHPPPHVHVIGLGGNVKVELGRDGDSPIVVNSKGLKRSDIRKAVDLVELHQPMLWDAWRRIHG